MATADKPEPFGPYLLLRPLGRGGMGVVYVARSRRSDHPILAVKRLRADAAQVPSFRERFDHECALALRLRHPRVVQALDAGEVNGVPYVASELVLGQDIGAIAERLASQGRGAPLKIAVRIMVDVLAGLDYVHQAHEPTGRPLHLVHRDVTPGNVLVGYDGVSRLADFGLAKSLLTEQLQLTATGTILGTPKFLAPEVALGATAGPRADLYGLGAVMYRLLVGRGPYDGDPREVLEAVLAGPPRPLRGLRPDLPDWFSAHLDRLMAREPQDRPASARDAGMALVDEARRHDAFLGRPRLGSWLQELFADEHKRQRSDLERDRQVDVSLVPAGEGTRVLKAPQVPLEGPMGSEGADEVDYDSRTLRPEDVVQPVTSGPTATAWRPDPAALTQVAGAQTAPRAHKGPRTVARDKRPLPDPPEPTLDGPSAPPAFGRRPVEGFTPSRAARSPAGPTYQLAAEAPSVGAASALRAPSMTARLPFARGRPTLALAGIALSAALLGGVAGVWLTRHQPPAPREIFTLAERLGAARRTVARLEAQGVSVPERLEQRLDAVKTMLLDGADLTRVQLELQELELTLENLQTRPAEPSRPTMSGG